MQSLANLILLVNLAGIVFNHLPGVDSYKEVLNRETFKRAANIALGHTYATVNNTHSAAQCCAECFLDDKCVAVNYMFKSSRCGLNDRSPVNNIDIYAYYVDPCEFDWFMFNQHCYLFVANSVSRGQGQSYCNTLESTLVEIQSKEENDFVRIQANAAGLRDYWLGLNDIEREDVFTWPSKAATNFTAWIPNEPNNATPLED